MTESRTKTVECHLKKKPLARPEYEKNNNASDFSDKGESEEKESREDSEVYNTCGTLATMDEQPTVLSRSEILYEPVRKINIYSRNRGKIAKLAHTLKRLSHEGKMDEFNAVVDAINNKSIIGKLQEKKCVRNCMEVADIKFTALDAQIEARRLKYDTSLFDGEVFAEMESIIKYTSDPIVSSMTYLARFGSAVSMKSTVDEGLAFLQYSREHSEHIMPCKDTGMVYYIEINLLSQKYEMNPSKGMKQEVLKSIERALAQFGTEPENIKKDYERMLMLKMAFCYLGLSLFGKKIKDVLVTDTDRKSAKKCFDFIEKPDIWERMERRRKMLYFLAASEYYRQESVFELSLLNAKEAEQIAMENKWTAELPNILDLIDDVEEKFDPDLVQEDSSNDVLQSLLQESNDVVTGIY